MDTFSISFVFFFFSLGGYVAAPGAPSLSLLLLFLFLFLSLSLLILLPWFFTSFFGAVFFYLFLFFLHSSSSFSPPSDDSFAWMCWGLRVGWWIEGGAGVGSVGSVGNFDFKLGSVMRNMCQKPNSQAALIPTLLAIWGRGKSICGCQ